MSMLHCSKLMGDVFGSQLQWPALKNLLCGICAQ